MIPFSKGSISFWFLHRNSVRIDMHATRRAHLMTFTLILQVMQSLSLQLASSVLLVWCIQ